MKKIGPLLPEIARILAIIGLLGLIFFILRTDNNDRLSLAVVIVQGIVTVMVGWQPAAAVPPKQEEPAHEE